jgi:16S rRNA (guanine527-N7)-methyltransferase
MDSASIARLLQPFLVVPLSPEQLSYISIYIDILRRWNARLNLTGVRQPEEIVTRHFGESFFAAQRLFPGAPRDELRALDLGSGAGFPGLPLKLWAPKLPVTLIESNQKKTAFLREVIRALALTDIDVFSGRAEDYPAATASLVTFRAVEHFEAALTAAGNLVLAGGRLALLVGQPQAARLHDLAPAFDWAVAIPIPLSSQRVLVVGTRRAVTSKEESDQ